VTDLTDARAVVVVARQWLSILPKEQCDTPVPIRPSTVAGLIDAFENVVAIRRVSTQDRAAENQMLTERLRHAVEVIRRHADVCSRAGESARLRIAADRLDPGAPS
jgi:hypothetical protein